MAQSGFNAEFIRAWENEDNDTVDAVVAELNNGDKEGERPTWEKKAVQKEAARYRKSGVNLRKFRKPRVLEKIVADEANAFLASLKGETPAEEGEE